MTSEIREVNMGFNRMARELAKVEQDRAVMLAGISHDLRTPLARLRLEAEMSVNDEEAQAEHGDGHRPARRHHRQVHGLRAPGRSASCVPVHVAADRRARGRGASATRAQIRITSKVAIDTVVLADDIELGRVSPEPVRERAPLRPLHRHRHRRGHGELRAHRPVGDHHACATTARASSRRSSTS